MLRRLEERTSGCVWETIVFRGLGQGKKASFESGLYCPIGQRRTSTDHTFSLVVFSDHRDVGHELSCPLWHCSHFQFLKGKSGLSVVAHTFNPSPKRQR